MVNPHDTLIRAALSRRAEAALALRALLPSELSAHLDLDGVALVPGRFVDAELRERQTDLLFGVPRLSGGTLLLYVLMEHQRRVEQRMAWRVLRYVVRFCDAWIEDHPDARVTLPPVYVLVVYNGTAAWTATSEVRDLFGLPRDQAAVLRPHQPALSHEIVDLSRVPDEVLWSGSLAGLTLLLLKHVDAPDLLARLPAWADAFAAVLAAPNGREALDRVITYILRATTISPEMLGPMLEREVLPNVGVEQMVMTTGQRLHEEGRVEGQLETLRTVLARQLERRFGPLPDELRGRIDALDQQPLLQAIDRILDAGSPDEVLPAS